METLFSFYEQKKVKVFIGVAVFLFLVHAVFFKRYITDDAFISFRYLDNFLQGLGLVYNAGERVWGYTNFLWIIVLAPFVKMGLDPLFVSRVFGLLFNSASLVLVMTFYSKSKPELRRWNWAAGFLLASSGAFTVQSLSGLETSLFTFLVLLITRNYMLYLKDEKINRLYGIGLCAAAAAMTRPEGYFVFGLIFLHFVYEHRTRREELWTLMKTALPVFSGIMSVFLLWAFLYYGAFWPNSITAKVGMSWEQIQRGLHYFMVFALDHPFPPLFLALSFLFFKKTEAIHRFLLLVCLFFSLFNITVGGDFMIGYRLFHVMITCSYLLVPFVISSFHDRIRSFTLSPQRVVYVLISGLLAVNLSLSILDPHIRYANRQDYVQNGIKVGKWMRENFKPDSLLATNDAGTIAYFSRLPIIDMMGLNDKVIAHRKDIPRLWKGNEKGYGRYVLARKPEYIMLGPVPGSEVPRWLSDIEIFESEEFWRNYRLERHTIDESTTLVVFKRRQKPRLEPYSEQFWSEIHQIAANRMLHSKYRY